MDNAFLNVRLESAAFPSDRVEISEMNGREAISQLFDFNIHVVYLDPYGLDVSQLLDNPATLVFERGGEEVRRMYGMIAEVKDCFETQGDYSSYWVRFVPRAWRLTLNETLDIFMEMSVPDIIAKTLERAGMSPKEDFEFRLKGTYPVREFVVQYKETFSNFVSRLAEHIGISYFFEHKNGKDVIVFSDDNVAFPRIGTRDGEAMFNPGGLKTGVYRFDMTTRTIPARYVVRDYNYRNPQLYLMGSVDLQGGRGGEMVEYGGNFKTPEEGEHLAMLRAEAALCRQRVYMGETDQQLFTAGATVTLVGLPSDDLHLLLTEVNHYATQPAFGQGGGGERSHRVTFTALATNVPFRPERVTPRPKVEGMLNGVIYHNDNDSSQSEYAEIDSDGRYRVKFLFDTADPGGRRASRLVRMAQPHSGAGYGMHFPLRPGTEVLVTFVNGDPDRPIIASTVPNPQTPSPVVSGNGKRNVIRTGGGNEINIDDNDGTHRIKMTTPHSNTTFQMGAPNAQEDGAIVATDGAYTTVAATGTGALGTMGSDIQAVSHLVHSNKVTSVADKEIPWFEGILTALEQSGELLATGIEATKTVVETMGKQKEQAYAKARDKADKDYSAIADKQAATDSAKADLLKSVSGNCKTQIQTATDNYDQARSDLQTARQQLAGDMSAAAVRNASGVNDQLSEYNAKIGTSPDWTGVPPDWHGSSYTGEFKTVHDIEEKTDGVDDPENDLRVALDKALKCAPKDKVEAYTAALDDQKKQEDAWFESAQEEVSCKFEVDNDAYEWDQGESGQKLAEAGMAAQAAQGGTGLLSTIYNLYNFVKQLFSKCTVGVSWTAGAATAAASLARSEPAAIEGPLLEPNARSAQNYVGSDHVASLYGEEKVYVWGDKAVLHGLDSASVVAAKKIHVMANDNVEVACTDRVQLTAGIMIDCIGGTVKIVQGEPEAPEAMITMLPGGIINIEATEINFAAEEGINFEAGGEITFDAGGAVAVDAGAGIELTAGADLSIEAGAAVEVTAAADLSLEAGAAVEVTAAADVSVEAAGEATIAAASIVLG